MNPMSITKKTPSIQKTEFPNASNDHLLVDRAKPVTTSAGGIHLPHKAGGPPPQYGIVVSVGPGVTSVEVGNVVFFNEAEAQHLAFRDVDLLVLAEMSVYATWDQKTARKNGLPIE